MKWLAAVLLSGVASSAFAADRYAEIGLSIAQLYFAKTKDESGTRASFSTQTSVLFHLGGQFAVGPALEYSRYVKMKGAYADSEWDVLIGPRAKFYFWEPRNSVTPYGVAQLMTGQGVSKGLLYDEQKNQKNRVQGGAGLLAPIGANSGLEVELSYENDFVKSKFKDGDVDGEATSKDLYTSVIAGFVTFL